MADDTMYLVEVFDWNVDEQTVDAQFENYIFADYSEALASFIFTYSKVGKIKTNVFMERVAVMLDRMQGDAYITTLVGYIKPINKMTVHKKPTHF